MAQLIMLTFDTTYGASAALSGVRALEELDYAWVDDVAVVERHQHGQFSIHTPHGSPARGAWWGAMAGMLVLWWFPPAWFLAGAIGGAGVGAAIGEALKLAGVDHELTERAKSHLANGTSALLLIGITGNAEEMEHAFERYKPTAVIREPIADDVVDKLSHNLTS